MVRKTLWLSVICSLFAQPIDAVAHLSENNITADSTKEKNLHFTLYALSGTGYAKERKDVFYMGQIKIYPLEIDSFTGSEIRHKSSFPQLEIGTEIEFFNFILGVNANLKLLNDHSENDYRLGEIENISFQFGYAIKLNRIPLTINPMLEGGGFLLATPAYLVEENGVKLKGPNKISDFFNVKHNYSFGGNIGVNYKLSEHFFLYTKCQFQRIYTTWYRWIPYQSVGKLYYRHEYYLNYFGLWLGIKLKY